ncbi:MAG: disulfide bond formation protein B [Alphaproteobacteria bacterium]|nr:disulfide bond formation protein B [Alphaproteobacteria bacterium]
MTTQQSLRADYVAIALGAFSLALILGALGFQYLGGMQPCEMCHWQRWPHIAAAMVGLLGGGFLPRRHGAPVVMVTILLVASSGLIGLYHTGVQYHLIGGPAACTVDHPYVLGSNMPVEARCDIPVYVLGLVFPAWNAILSFGAVAAAIILLARGGDDTKA